VTEGSDAVVAVALDPVAKLVVDRLLESVGTWGRYYDHNFLRFSPIFGEKIGVFLKKQCNDQNFT
jgi:hypothetical protein